MTAGSAQQGPLPYLDYCGVEVANAARTLSYLRGGLGDTMQGHWILGVGDVCGVLYRTETSGCTQAVFTSPAADPAPWYDPNEPGSETFLGAILLDLKGYDSTIYRGVSPRTNALGGGVFTGQHRKPRAWTFRAALVSADDAGAEYGLRWLTSVLQASACVNCSTCELTVRLVCPPDDCTDETLGEWVSYDVALIEGPKEVQTWAPGAPADAMAGCRDLVIVEWTMTAGNPFLYKPAVEQATITIEQATECTDICTFLFGTSDPACVDVEPPTRGYLGSIWELTTEDGFGGLFLEAFVDCGSDVDVENPDLRIELSQVPASSTVVVDSSQHKITVYTTDPDSGEIVSGDGTYLVLLAEDSSIQWLEVADCDTIMCFCIRASSPCASGTVQATLLTQTREG